MITSLHIVSYRLSTSNHNCRRCEIILDILYLIVFLHQTTTCARLGVSLDDCILSSFYIKPQLDLERTQRSYHCILSSFYIKPQLSTAAFTDATYCILSSFYIKPQRDIFKSLTLNYLGKNIVTKSEMMRCLFAAKLLKKIQLKWSWPNFFFNLSPNINYI